MLASRGRITPKATSPNWLERALSESRCVEAPVNFAVASEASRIRLPQNDLADVLLAATASVWDLTLITSDEQLLGCSWLRTLADD